MTTYLSVLGTRPEIIKMAMLHRELTLRGARSVVLHTGQHEAMAAALYRYFEMGPDVRVQLERRSDTLAHLTSLLLEHVDHAIAEVQPDVVLVQGDTTSAMVGALAAFYRGKPVAHVEAGLRTFARDPFPEEKNRELIGRLAEWHFPPTAAARANLLAEGVPGSRLFEVGNTVIDAAVWVRGRLERNGWDTGDFAPPEVRSWLTADACGPLVLITAHRRENWGEPIRRIARAVGTLLEAHQRMVAIWPVHPNPRVREDVEAVVHALPVSARERFCLTEPLQYPALIAVLARSHFTLTDSGGIQEEASALRCPVLIARAATERQELVQAGGALLVGCDCERIVTEASRLLEDEARRRSMQLDTCPFGDGHAAERIAERLAHSVELQS